jgi:hypothetical protein
MRRIICAKEIARARAIRPWSRLPDGPHAPNAVVWSLAFIFHIPARHEAQFGIYPLRQPRQGSLVAAPCKTKKYINVAAFAVRFRLYQRKENKLSE